jgi:hypothetical protein
LSSLFRCGAGSRVQRAEREEEKEQRMHVEDFEVLADFGNELFASLVALREGRVCLRQGERGAHEGEKADALVGFGPSEVMVCDLWDTWRHFPRPFIWRGVLDEDHSGSVS